MRRGREKRREESDGVTMCLYLPTVCVYVSVCLWRGLRSVSLMPGLRLEEHYHRRGVYTLDYR